MAEFVSDKKSDPTGHYEPVHLVSRVKDPIAMKFECDCTNFPGNLTNVIDWVRDAFYCLTDGEEVIVKKKCITRSGATDPDSPQLDHMTLVLFDKGHDSLVIVKSGDWIAWDELNGYRTLTQAEVEANFVITKIDKASSDGDTDSANG